MSTSEATVAYPVDVQRDPSADRPPLERLAERLNPKQGWDSFVLLVAAVGVAVWTVREANWVETPGLMRIVLWSCLVGLLLAKTKAPWPILHLLGLAIGLVVVVLQGTALVEGQSLAEQIRESWSRLSVWYEAATTGGISTDLLPFTLALLALTWLLGFFSSWFLFRSTNVWVGLVLAGVAILTNLTFLPEYFEARDLPFTIRIEVLFFVFMFFAMMLVVRVGVVQRQDRWRGANFGLVSSSKWLAVPATVGLSVVVLAVSAALPLKVYVSKTAVSAWNVARSPVGGLEDEFARLFSGISSRKDVAGRFFGKTLPFQGKISFEGEVVIWATSEDPAYWLSRTYDHYTSEGWMTGESTKQSLKSGAALPPQESFKRVPAFQRLNLTFDTVNLLSGGNLEWVDRETVVETLKPLKFEIHLFDHTGDREFPDDISELAGELRQTLGSAPSIFVESTISRMLPLDLVLVGFLPEGDAEIEKVVLERKAPTLPDVVSWKFADQLNTNEGYTMRSLVSKATDDDLRSTGTEYSGFTKDLYLQTPASLPDRVRDLAAEVTGGAETQLDKALAVRDYLRGPDFEYSRNIGKPPRGADGVDHFLFQTRKGYSDYFASAMAVMLRTVGVPARLAAGYSPGKLTDTASLRAVRDSDSHGWTQVYFPGHGWIDFEPTPRWEAMEHGVAEQTEDEREDPAQEKSEDDSTASDIDRVSECVGDSELFAGLLSLFEECLELEVGAAPGLDALFGDASQAQRPWVGVTAVTAAGVLAGLWLISWLMWTRGLANVGAAERAYTKMSRLGALAGIGRRAHQTPIEYSRALGNLVPATAAGAQAVAWAFALGRYGGAEPKDQEIEDMDDAWKSIRGGLLGQVFRRLVRVGRR